MHWKVTLLQLCLVRVLVEGDPNMTSLFPGEMLMPRNGMCAVHLCPWHNFQEAGTGSRG